MVVADRAAGRPTPPPPPPKVTVPKFTSSAPPPPPPPKVTVPKFTSTPPPPPPRTTTPPTFTPNFVPPRGTANQTVQSPSPMDLLPKPAPASQVVQSPSPMDIARVSGASSSSLARQLQATGATAGEANRFANIANGVTGTPPSAPPMFTPKFTTTRPTTPPAVVSPEPETTTDTPDETVEEQLPPAEITPDPQLPAPPPPPAATPKIKSAPIDTVLFDDDAVPAEIIADLLFEQIGGQELLTIARNDTVNGQSVLYQPIKNLNDIQQQYNPNNLLRLKDTIGTIFGNFSIDLANKIPQIGNGPNGANIYLDANRNIVIEFINILPDEQVEVQITSSGTIYEIG